MKLKKFFAGVLAAAMMLTVGATAAFAEGPAAITHNQALTATSEIPLYKTYEVKNGTAPAETFSFQVKYLQVIRQDKAATAPYNNETVINLTGKETAFGSMTKGSESKSFTVTPTELGLGNPTGTGKYLYEISENAGQTVATTYAAPVYMAVTVAHKVDAETNQIKTGEYEYYVTMFSSKEAALNATGDSATGKVNNTEAFTNTYGAGNSVNDVTLSKTVHGSFGDLSKTFDFIVKFEKPASATDVTYGAIVATKSDKSIIIKQGETVISAEGSADAVNLEYGKEYTVTMKHDQNVVFSNLPANVTYTMTEDGAVAGKLGDYTVTGEQSAKKTMGSADETVAIVNTHEGTPDMGVVLDNAPYIAMLAIVAIGGVALMLNKRRRDEE